MPSDAPRGCLLLEGDAAWCQSVAAGLAGDCSPCDLTWCGPQAPPGIAALQPRQAGTRLGGECALLVFDAHAGFDPNAFAALSGTLRGGGWLVLLVPPLDAWPRQHDGSRAALAAWPRGQGDVSERFLRRIVNILQHSDVAMRCAQGGVPPPLQLPADAAGAPLQLTPAQRAAVAAVLRVARGHARRPLVLTADRGRGKSAVLAHAAATWLAEDARRVLLVLPHQVAAAVFRRVLRERLPEAQHAGDLVEHPAGGRLRILLAGAAELPEETAQASVVLVDEAAAVPVALLQALLQRANRLVFATTVHGYEGSGRGFELRFKAHLERRMPQWRGVELDRPVRWPADDPLERLTRRMLLLDTALPPSVDRGPGAGPRPLEVARIERDLLLADEELLSAIFGLLVNAHYQTRPSDLRFLLDAPDVELWLARRGEQLLGVLLGVHEGGLDSDLAEAVRRGRRRPRGHLLAQSLAAHAGCAPAASARLLRVMRIAVHPQAWRQGIGSRLVDALAGAAASGGSDALGVSFGCEAGTLAFWRSVGFVPVRLGTRRDPASGTWSLQMLRPLGDSPLAERLAVRMRAQLPWGLGAAWRTLDPGLAAMLLAGRQCEDLPLGRDGLEDLAAVGAGERDPAGCPGSMWKAALRLCAGRAGADVPPALNTVACAALLQARPPAEVVALAGLAGRDALQASLRELAARVFHASYAGDVDGPGRRA